MSLLIKHGANVDAVNAQKKTALFISTALDRTSISKLLLDKGADPNAKDVNLNRPLHFVQSVESASDLIQFGAKLNVKNKQGNTPLHLAFAQQNRAVANGLTGLGSNQMLENDRNENCLDVAKYLQTKIAIPFFSSDEAFSETGGIDIK